LLFEEITANAVAMGNNIYGKMPNINQQEKWAMIALFDASGEFPYEFFSFLLTKCLKCGIMILIKAISHIACAADMQHPLLKRK
jgi:hypothetical protein